MLLYTNEQINYVKSMHKQFDDSQKTMAKNFNVPNDGAGDRMFSGNALTVPYDSWKVWDKEAVEIQRSVLSVFSDMASISTPMSLAYTIHNFETHSDSGEVNISLDGRGKARGDQPEIEYHSTPLPLIDTSFNFGWRQMMTMKASGTTLDSTAQNNAVRRLSERMEKMVLDGEPSINVGGSTIYGLRTAPNRITGTHGIDINGAAGADIVKVFKNLIQAFHAKNYYTPVTIYMNFSDWFYMGATEYTANYPKKIIDVVMEIPGIDKIVPASLVNANEVFGLCKRRDVYSILNGMPITTRALTRLRPEDDYVFNVMAAVAPEFKFDANKQAGYAQFTK